MLVDLVKEFLSVRPERSWDWQRWREPARAEGLLGLLAARSAEPAAREQARSEFARQAAYHHELRQIDRELAEAELPAVLLKGHALLPYYRNQLLLRPSGDVDLLVRRGQRERARATLRLTRTSRRESSPLEVDLAEDLVGAERIRARARLYRFDEGRVWARSRPLGPDFQALRTLDPVYLFLHLAGHALKHGYSRLIWLVDLGLVLPGLDPEETLSAARETGCEQAVALAAELVYRLSGLDSPLRTGLGAGERACVGPILRRTFPAEAGELLCLLRLPDWGSRAAFLLELVLLRPAEVRRLYPGPLWRGYLRRLRRLGSLLRRILS